ncbi:MAG TPA: efflux RND transporter periplasmic adaptor subunit [Devosia sp.]|jgi:multidrug efflux system membrane fusion protein|nr:efflux RND transporter periplasmic adaptor subunit [Devosia sp.]
MRAIYSYGVALVIVLVLAVWLATGTLVVGGKGAGNGEKPVVSLIEKNGGPLTNAVEKSGINDKASAAIDPSQTIAERTDAQGNGANAAPRSVRIDVLKAQNMPIDVPLLGKTKAKASVTVVAQTSDTVQQVNVIKGQNVKPGDTLCTLDPGARQLAVQQAQAGADQAQTAYDSNQALVQKGLAAQNSSLAAQATLASAKTALQNAQLELGRTVIKTDIGGVVEDPLAQVGSMLAAGAPCATVVQLDPMLVTASVPEAKIQYARVGLSAKVTTVTGDTVDGKVTYVGATADDATRSFPIEIEVPNADGKLRDGVTATAVVDVGTAPVQVIPQSALTLDDNGVLGIRTVESGSKVAFHEVAPIKDTRDGVWVIGLPSTINLITVGQEYVEPGQIVDAKTADGEPAAS